MHSRTESLPSRWTLHGLNSGFVFSATMAGVRWLPRAVSYGLGWAGAWVAWRLMPRTNDAIAANLEALFPAESTAQRRRRALDVYRSYTRDAIDFIRALRAPAAEAAGLFDLRPEDGALFADLLARGNGLILVTAHWGNWEAGGILVSRTLRLPTTVVAMAEPSPTVNRIRHETRAAMGIETLEVRQSLDTALQLRRALAENRIVAMLMDRHLGRDRVAVRLLGRDAWFLMTPVLMAYLTGAPLVTCFIDRIGPGRFRARPGRAITVDRTMPRDQAIREAAQQLADDLEVRIRQRPECWYHFYRYWDAQRDDFSELG
jgi:lauroyl/myristoyl acyltransferase